VVRNYLEDDAIEVFERYADFYWLERAPALAMA
jgi:hypothetical protein